MGFVDKKSVLLKAFACADCCRNRRKSELFKCLQTKTTSSCCFCLAQSTRKKNIFKVFGVWIKELLSQRFALTSLQREVSACGGSARKRYVSRLERQTICILPAESEVACLK